MVLKTILLTDNFRNQNKCWITLPNNKRVGIECTAAYSNTNCGNMAQKDCY